MMEASVVEFKINPQSPALIDYQQEHKPAKPNTIISLYTLLFILNTVTSMNIGSMIVIKDMKPYFFLMFPLSIMGSITFSLLPIQIITRLFSKSNILINLFIHFIFLIAFILSLKYLIDESSCYFIIIISMGFVSLSQGAITLFTLQWIQHFSYEGHRLSLILSMQLTPVIGILVGVILEYYLNVSFSLQCGLIGVIGVALCFVPVGLLQNCTKEETEEFLRNSNINNSLRISTQSSYLYKTRLKDAKRYMAMIGLAIGYCALIEFEFSIRLYNGFTLDNGGLRGDRYTISSFCSICVIIPVLGVILGGCITHYLSMLLSVIANIMMLVLSLIAILLVFIIKPTSPSSLSQSMSIEHQIYLALMLLFQMSTIPIILKSLNQMMLSPQSRQICFQFLTFTTHLLGLLLGGVIGSIFPNSNDSIIFYSSIAAVIICLLFGLECLRHSRLNKLSNDTDAPLYKYQIFLIIANVFGRIALIAWNDYYAESVVGDIGVNGNANAQVNAVGNLYAPSEGSKSDRVTHHTSGTENEEGNGNGNRFSEMTFNNNDNRTTYNEQALRFSFNEEMKGEDKDKGMN